VQRLHQARGQPHAPWERQAGTRCRPRSHVCHINVVVGPPHMASAAPMSSASQLWLLMTTPQPCCKMSIPLASLGMHTALRKRCEALNLRQFSTSEPA